MCHLFTTLKTTFPCSESNKCIFNPKPLLRTNLTSGHPLHKRYCTTKDMKSSGDAQLPAEFKGPQRITAQSFTKLYGSCRNWVGHCRDPGEEGVCVTNPGQATSLVLIFSEHVQTLRVLMEFCSEHEDGIWVIKTQGRRSFSYRLIWTDRDAILL